MQGYLGETPIDISDTAYSEYTPKDWALFYIKKYGGIDGAHHKDWVLDQVTIVDGCGAQILITQMGEWTGRADF